VEVVSVSVSNPADSDDRSEKFVREFARYEHELFRYVLTLLANWDDAQDVMQETAMVLWRHFDSYDPARPFLPWACTFAYHQVSNFRSRKHTFRKMFSDKTVECLASEYAQVLPEIQSQREALNACIEKLEAKDRALIRARYEPGFDALNYAQSTERTTAIVYRSLRRIRRLLLECVSRGTSAET
jgi:RNA polymerase sigma-70 factor (ECF subfamily)